MKESSLSPLDAIREQFWRHTDRNPIDSEAVLVMIHEAINTLDDPVNEHQDNPPSQILTLGLVKSLDPDTRGGLGIYGALLVEKIGALVADDSATRVEQWGALSILGLLAMTRDPEIENNPTQVDPSVYRAQLPSTLAHSILRKVVKTKTVSKDRRGLASALIGNRTIYPTEDVAIELLSLQTNAPSPEDSELPTIISQYCDEQEDTDIGNRLGEPRDCALALLDSKHPIRKMDWISPGFDFAAKPVAGRSVYRDGIEVAQIFDLTVCNKTLNEFNLDLQQSEMSSKFWSLLTNAVVNLTVFNKGRQPDKPKVPTFGFGNAKVPNSDIVRGYFVPLGTNQKGLRTFGLVAASRTKERQKQALRLITNSTRRMPK